MLGRPLSWTMRTLISQLITVSNQNAQNAIEAILVVSLSHLCLARMALAATISSGIRSIFGYSPTLVVESWDPFRIKTDILGGHVMDTFDELAKNAPFGNGRVQLGFAFDAWNLPRECVVPLFEKVKAAGVKRITSHYVRSVLLGPHSLPEIANSYGLLDSSILWSHASNWTDSDVELFKKSGSMISSTASSELQMGHGLPIAYQDCAQQLRTQIGIGIDCHSSAQGSIPAEMRLGLQSARAIRNEKFIEKGLVPVRVKPTVEDAFNLGTINGARALGMGEEIGSIQVGKLADLVIFDATSPAMVCGAHHEPVAAIVLHSSPADIDYVIIDGEVKKKGGKLVPVEVEGSAKSALGKETLEWKDVAKELLRSREQIQKKAETIDYKVAREGVSKMFQLDLSRLVDEVPERAPE
jgi:hypothetical protein